jgi:hypothetical protein
MVFGSITLVFGLIIWMNSRSENKAEANAKLSTFFGSTAVTAGTILLLFLIGNPVIYNRMGGKPQALISDLTSNRLSEREAALLQRGYYEDLIGVNRFNSQLEASYRMGIPSGYGGCPSDKRQPNLRAHTLNNNRFQRHPHDHQPVGDARP